MSKLLAKITDSLPESIKGWLRKRVEQFDPMYRPNTDLDRWCPSCGWESRNNVGPRCPNCGEAWG